MCAVLSVVNGLEKCSICAGNGLWGVSYLLLPCLIGHCQWGAVVYSPDVGQSLPCPPASCTRAAPVGLCALCPNSNNSLMVYPSRGIGRVELLDLGTQESEAKEIVAHETAITCIALNLQGTRAATASEKVQGST